MAKLIYVGQNGNTIDLFSNKWFQLVNVDGLTHTSSNISSSTNPNIDGDKVNLIQTQPRSIILDLMVKPDVNVEDAKRDILRTVKPKQRGKLRMVYKGRSLEIDSVVESINMPRFNNSVTMQIGLYCSQPYWMDIENVLVEIARVIDWHYFPTDEGGLSFPSEGIPFGVYDLKMTRSCTNDGDADCGMVITIIAVANVVNPTIYKADGSFIGVNDTMEAGDEIIINTNRGEKAITKNGVNILSKIKKGSTFLQLDVGVNELTIDSDDETEGNVYFVLTFKRRFV